VEKEGLAVDLDAPMTLNQARTHAFLRILVISDDWATRRSLNQLGLYAGEQVHVLRRAPFGGPLVIESRNSRVAISRQLAERIRVEVIP
jgi:Fe2+ transport system protein FeoA